MTHILVSPAEPEILKGLGTVSSLPERYGVDFLWQSEQGEWCGIQRKELSDLIASVQGDRLAREIVQMKELALRSIIIEGRPVWGPNGNLLDKFGKWSRQAHHSLIQSLGTSGIVVHHSTDISDTAFVIQSIVKWSDKDEHVSLLGRPKDLPKTWGEPDDRDRWCWLLMGIDGVSIKRARQLVDFFGTLPMRWTITESDLCQVKGIGKELARRIYRALPVSDAPTRPLDSSSTPSPASLSQSALSTAPDTRH